MSPPWHSHRCRWSCQRARTGIPWLTRDVGVGVSSGAGGVGVGAPPRHIRRSPNAANYNGDDGIGALRTDGRTDGRHDRLTSPAVDYVVAGTASREPVRRLRLAAAAGACLAAAAFSAEPELATVNARIDAHRNPAQFLPTRRRLLLPPIRPSVLLWHRSTGRRRGNRMIKERTRQWSIRLQTALFARLRSRSKNDHVAYGVQVGLDGGVCKILMTE